MTNYFGEKYQEYDMNNKIINGGAATLKGIAAVGNLEIFYINTQNQFLKMLQLKLYKVLDIYVKLLRNKLIIMRKMKKKIKIKIMIKIKRKKKKIKKKIKIKKMMKKKKTKMIIKKKKK